LKDKNSSCFSLFSRQNATSAEKFSQKKTAIFSLFVCPAKVSTGTDFFLLYGKGLSREKSQSRYWFFIRFFLAKSAASAENSFFSL